MSKGKPHIEFTKLDLNEGWETPPGYPAGMQQKLLASDLDGIKRSGSRSRLLRIAAGCFSTKPFVHDHWEEVHLFEGDLIVGNDENGNGGEQFWASTYACRPPGVHHGPFKSEHGCVLFELHYYREPE